jgi:hypothetical protein
MPKPLVSGLARAAREIVLGKASLTSSSRPHALVA